MRRRHRSPRRLLQRVASNALAVILVGLVAAGMTTVLTGHYQVRPVLSGSMRPGLPIGGLVVTQRVPVSSLDVRDVIVFHRPDKPQDLVVHRIISMKHDASGPVIQTQGDANNTADPWHVTLNGTTAYKAVFTVPLLGYAAVWVHSPIGREVFLLVGAILVLGAATSGLIAWRRNTHGQKGDSMPAELTSSAGSVDTAAC